MLEQDISVSCTRSNYPYLFEIQYTIKEHTLLNRFGFGKQSQILINQRRCQLACDD